MLSAGRMAYGNAPRGVGLRGAFSLQPFAAGCGISGLSVCKHGIVGHDGVDLAADLGYYGLVFGG